MIHKHTPSLTNPVQSPYKLILQNQLRLGARRGLPPAPHGAAHPGRPSPLHGPHRGG